MATLRGSLVAIVTPMDEDGGLDLHAFRRLIDWHIAEGTDGIVVVGTTGESPTVDFDEHHLLIKTAVEHVAGRVPVIAGTGANSTREAIELAAYANHWGRHEPVVVPTTKKPTQRGSSPFRAVRRAVNTRKCLQRTGLHRSRSPGPTPHSSGSDSEHCRDQEPPQNLGADATCCGARPAISWYSAVTTPPDSRSCCWAGMA